MELKPSCCDETVAFEAGHGMALAGVRSRVADGAPSDIVFANSVKGNLSKMDFEIPSDDLNFGESCPREKPLYSEVEYLVLVNFEVVDNSSETEKTPEERRLCTVPAGVLVTGNNAINRQCVNAPVISSPGEVAQTFACGMRTAFESLVTLGTAGTVTFDIVPEACAGKVETGIRYGHNNFYSVPVTVQR